VRPFSLWEKVAEGRMRAVSRRRGCEEPVGFCDVIHGLSVLVNAA
jgi:hypothetical protein